MNLDDVKIDWDSRNKIFTNLRRMSKIKFKIIYIVRIGQQQQQQQPQQQQQMQGAKGREIIWAGDLCWHDNSNPGIFTGSVLLSQEYSVTHLCSSQEELSRLWF